MEYDSSKLYCFRYAIILSRSGLVISIIRLLSQNLLEESASAAQGRYGDSAYQERLREKHEEVGLPVPFVPSLALLEGRDSVFMLHELL